MMYILAVALLALATPFANAQSQTPERILYEGQDRELLTIPLDQYEKPYPIFHSLNPPELWRGYVASWEIKDGALYLKDVEGEVEHGDKIIDAFFGNVDKPVPATWFSGDLRIPNGNKIRSDDAGFAHLYESELIVSVKAGKVVSTKTIEATPEEINGLHEVHQIIQERVEARITDVHWDGEVVTGEIDLY